MRRLGGVLQGKGARLLKNRGRPHQQMLKLLQIVQAERVCMASGEGAARGERAIATIRGPSLVDSGWADSQMSPGCVIRKYRRVRNHQLPGCNRSCITLTCKSQRHSHQEPGLRLLGTCTGRPVSRRYSSAS